MPGQSAAWITTARALRRAGFGVTGPEVDAAVTRDWPGHVDAMLDAMPGTDPGALATPMPTLQTPRRPGKNAAPAARKQFNQRLFEQQDVLSDWWLRRMVAVQQPVREKLTLLWHNHFATSAQKVREAAYMAAHNQKLRHGNGYTENDVRNGARALTGWVIGADGQTSMVPKRHDGTAKTLFGVTRNFDAAGFCDTVLAQPRSAEYVAGRLWQQLASDDPPSPGALDRLVSAYGPGRNLRALTTAILTGSEFTGGGGAPPASRVNTPVEWLVGVVRALRAPIDTPAHRKLADATLHALGQRPLPADAGVLVIV